jgi:hypothetical protein
MCRPECGIYVLKHVARLVETGDRIYFVLLEEIFYFRDLFLSSLGESEVS